MKLLKYQTLAILLLTLSTAFSQKKEAQKIKSSAAVLKEFGGINNEIPQKLINATEGIIIIPGLINAGFVVAGERGKGVAMVKNAKGNWSDPVFVTITGGSAGFQAGVQSVDLILLFKTRETLLHIGRGSFTLGGDASITAGPFGRNSTASTDYKLEAEIYSYSKSKGLFGGFSLTGSSLLVNQKAITDFYGKTETADDIFHSSNKNHSGEIKELKSTLGNIFR